MTRLTNDMRGEIVYAAITSGFRSRADALISRQAELANVVYLDLFRKEHLHMDKLAKGWLPEVNEIKVQSHDDIVSLTFSGNFNQHNDPFMYDPNMKPVFRRVPYNMKSGCLTIYDPGTPIYSQISGWTEQIRALKKAIKEAQHRTTATLDKFTTVEKLLEAWPEIKPFIPEKAQPVLLPAIPTAQLNSMLGLA